MIVLDTTVLVYAVGSDHPYRQPCRELVQAVSTGALEATTTVEVLQEFAQVRSRRMGRADAGEVTASYADLLGPLVSTQEAHLRAGLRLWGEHQELGCFDAVLAAVARDVGASSLVSADLGFAELRDLEHVVPDDLGVASLLRR